VVNVKKNWRQNLNLEWLKAVERINGFDFSGLDVVRNNNQKFVQNQTKILLKNKNWFDFEQICIKF
jgi:hypothetical protein